MANPPNGHAQFNATIPTRVALALCVALGGSSTIWTANRFFNSSSSLGSEHGILEECQTKLGLSERKLTSEQAYARTLGDRLRQWEIHYSKIQPNESKKQFSGVFPGAPAHFNHPLDWEEQK